MSYYLSRIVKLVRFGGPEGRVHILGMISRLMALMMALPEVKLCLVDLYGGPLERMLIGKLEMWSMPLL